MRAAATRRRRWRTLPGRLARGGEEAEEAPQLAPLPVVPLEADDTVASALSRRGSRMFAILDPVDQPQELQQRQKLQQEPPQPQPQPLGLDHETLAGASGGNDYDDDNGDDAARPPKRRSRRRSSQRSSSSGSSGRGDGKMGEPLSGSPELVDLPPKPRSLARLSRRESLQKIRSPRGFERVVVSVREKRRAAAKLATRFMESDRFLDMVDHVFDEVDVDGSGAINAAELYAAVLLLYHEINRIPWGGYKPPPQREHVMTIMRKYDWDEDNNLRHDEFTALCQDLCGNIVFDVSKRILLVLFVFPMMAMPLKELLAVLPYLAIVLDACPDHVFSSAVVALFVTVLPYMEHVLHATYTWEAVEFSTEKELKQFRRRRRREIEASHVRRFLRRSKRGAIE